MQPTFVEVRVRRDLPHRPDDAYAWLTDYRDDDHTLTDVVVKKRTVVKRDADSVLLDAHIVAAGTSGRGLAEVRLFPTERRWVATIVEGRAKGSVYEYALTPSAQGSRLDILYRVRVKRWKSRLLVWLARPKLRRELEQMWSGFEAAMAKDLR